MILTRILRAQSWTSALMQAEKLVGYSSGGSLFSPLLTDEFSNVLLSGRKLIGSKHPLLEIAKQILYNGQHAVQARGLIVLLVSQAANNVEKSLTPSADDALIDSIYQSQRTIAEVTEIIYSAHLIHKCVMNQTEIPQDDAKNLTFGNKMAILGGDFLLSTASKVLANLGNPNIVGWIAGAIGDMVESDFVGTDMSNGKFSCTNYNDWERRTLLGSGSLLGQSCKSALAVVGHSEDLQSMALEFGQKASLTLRIVEEIERPTDSIDLLMQERNKFPEILSQQCDDILKFIDFLPQSHAKNSLCNLVTALKIK